MKVYLASQSPRRKELLSTLVKEFEIIESNFDESSIKKSSPKALVKALSEGKCKQVFDSLSNERCVIGADTVVCINNQILGKPKDKTDAKRMLKMLSGKTHQVITGVCVMITDNASITKINFVSSSKVVFCNLTEEEIDDYIATNEPCDKAGAYAIQGLAGKFIQKINGTYQNIVGLPVDMLYKVLKQENII